MEPSEVPAAVLAEVRRRCLTLPEVEETADRFAHSWRVRRRVIAYLLTIDDPAGRPVTMVVCRADPEERAALLAIGHPYFAPRNGTDRVGILVDGATDWSEIGELIAESFRLLAPKKLVALLDAGTT